MKNPACWNKADLYRHLQHALDLELWTIPLYLTSLYSIKNLMHLNRQDYPDAAKLLYSVAMQEMLHVELVCNISNALGHAPKFHIPNYDERKQIPFIHPQQHWLPQDLKGYKVKPQALSHDSLKLFCAIELPHPQRAIDWEKQKQYDSIAGLYEALKTGVTQLWNDCYVGDAHNTKQKNSFKELHNRHGKNHGFSIQINSVETALLAIEAIIEQGEGADNKKVPADFRPPAVKEGEEFATATYRGNLSHYQKFRMLLHSQHKLPATYQITQTDEAETANLLMQRDFLSFWHVMETDFNSEGTELQEAFMQKMYALAHSLTKVWEAGRCPDFNFSRREERKIEDNRHCVEVTKDGPYRVSGNVPLSKGIMIPDEAGIPEQWQAGNTFSGGETYYLCRCGNSKHKPFCDNTHLRIPFDGTEAQEKKFSEVMETVEGPELILQDARPYCASARFCKRAGGIRELVANSDKPEFRQIAIEEVLNCSSGRLVLTEKETNEVIEQQVESALIVAEDLEKRVSGPICLKGSIQVISSEGKPYEVRKRVTLCRCGKSNNKPFCDGTHIRTGFNDGDKSINQ